jgi:hypothetical protein
MLIQIFLGKGAVLQPGRSRVRDPMRPLNLSSICLILPAATMSLGFIRENQKIFGGGVEVRPARKADSRHL